MTTTLTISLIVRNEEKSLGGCLDSVAGLGGDIVVVDTGSEDRTREVAAAGIHSHKQARVGISINGGKQS